MLVANLEQNTQEWLDFRMDKIGASEINFIMGVSPYLTKRELWRIKCRLDQPKDNPWAFEHGKRLEPIARRILEDKLGVTFEPVVVVSDEHPFLMASLDGMDKKLNWIWEHKSPQQHEHDALLVDGIPEKYFYQVQQQLLCSGAELCIFSSIREKDDGTYDVNHCTVYPDQTAFEQIIKEGVIFMDHVKQQTEPPLTAKDWLRYEDNPDYLKVSGEYAELHAKKKELETQMKELKHYLETNAPHVKTISGLVKIQKLEVKGNVDYKSIPVLKAIDLEKFRKPPRIEWRVNVSKGDGDDDE